MKTPQNKKESRHGKRTEGKVQTSITVTDELLRKAKEAAEKDGRSLSNWLEQLIKKSLLIILFAMLACPLLLEAPMDAGLNAQAD